MKIKLKIYKMYTYRIDFGNVSNINLNLNIPYLRKFIRSLTKINEVVCAHEKQLNNLENESHEFYIKLMEL